MYRARRGNDRYFLRMPSRLNPYLRATFGALAFSMGLSVAGASGQAAPAGTDTARTTPDTTRAAVIRSEDIPAQASETETRLRDLESQLPRDPAVARSIVSARSLADSLPSLIQGQQRVASRLMTRRALIDYSLEWERRSADVQEWRRTLRARIGGLEGGRQELGQSASRWTATLQAARHDWTTGEVLGLAEATLKDILGLERRVKERLDELLAAEVQLSDVQLKIQRQQESLAQQAEEQFRDLLRIDSPPFWRLGVTLSLQGLGDTIGRLWQENLRALLEFLRAYAWKLLAHSVLAILLIRFFRRGRARLGAAPDDPLHAEPASNVLQRPESAALLVASLALLWFYPRAPLIVYDLALLASVAPMLQIRLVLVPPRLHRIGLWIAILMVIQRLISIIGSGTDVERLGVLALSIAGGVLLWRGLRPGGALLARDAGSWPKAIELVARVLLAGFGLSLAANVVGNVSLASISVSTMLTLSYLGMVLVAATKVLDVTLSEFVRFGSRHSVFIRTYGPGIRRRGYWLLDATAVVTWAWVALFSYYLADDFVTLLKGWLGTSWSIGQVEVSIGTALLFVAVLWIGAMIARFISLVLELDVLGQLSLPRGVPVTVGSLVRYALVAIAFLVALAATGFEISQLAIIGGALGVGIGFGLQTIVGNFVAGLILAFERPISIGDIVQLGELTGEVRQIGIRASILHTFDGAEVIVPNSELISREVINWTRSDRMRRIEVRVGVAYGSDPRQVLQLLLAAAQTHPEVAAEPEPDVRFIGFGDSSLDFSLRFWCDFARSALIQSNVAVAVHDALAAAGIGIPFPQRDLHLRSADPGLLRQLGISGESGRSDG